MDSLALAKTIADRVEMAGARAEVPVAVSVIDTHGNVILKHRMSGSPAGRRSSPPEADRSLATCVRVDQTAGLKPILHRVDAHRRTPVGTRPSEPENCVESV